MRASEGTVSPWLIWATAIGVVLFPSFVLVVPSGDSYIFTLLAIFSAIAYFQQRTFLGFTDAEKRYFWIVLIFVAAAFLNHFYTGPNSTGVKKLTRYMYFLLVFPFIGLFVRTKLKASYVWIGLMLGALTGGFLAVSELITSGQLGSSPESRLGGALNPIRFGGISMFLSAACLLGFLWFKRQGHQWAWVMIPASCLALLAAVGSGTRGAWIIFPFYFLIFLVAWWRRMSSRTRAGVIFVSLVIPIAAYLIPQTQIAQRISDANDDLTTYLEDSSKVNPGNVRLEMWRNAYEMFEDSPIIGIGLGHYQNLSREKVAEGQLHPMVAKFKNPHNMYLSALSTQGIIGLVLAVAVIAWPLFFAWRKMKEADNQALYAQTIAALTVGYLVLMTSNDLMDVKASVMFFALVLGQFMYLLRLRDL